MTDPKNVRLVIVFLGIICLASLVGVIFLLSDEKDASLVGAFGTGALGALGSLLVSTRSQADPAISEAIEKVSQDAWSAGSANTESAIHQLDKGTKSK